VEPTDITAVRRFNRLVTQRVGALDDHYLSRQRPLGEARVLWEIGVDGCDVRTLRARLDLDSGYLSRLLRSLEAAGLVSVGAGAGDARVRTARLTAAGRRERTLLDARSDSLAASMLAHLGDGQRRRLVDAMGEVERLLSAALVDVAVVDPATPAATACLGEYFAELDRRFDDGFEAARSNAPDVDGFRPPHGRFVVATLHGEPVGCGGLRFHGKRTADLKRMWVSASVRGLGLGRRLLTELEATAAAAGARTVRLETNRALTEAIAMYRAAGYVEVEPFNDEVYGDHWFEKSVR
jgi:DNA-binding MarR family transcriptional regulator/GNAT superfamily N-acetyltransferase